MTDARTRDRAAFRGGYARPPLAATPDVPRPPDAPNAGEKFGLSVSARSSSARAASRSRFQTFTTPKT